MTLPPLPRGIYRDDTVHDRRYFTAAQMRAYAQAAIDAIPRTHTPQAPYKVECPEFMGRIFGNRR